MVSTNSTARGNSLSTGGLLALAIVRLAFGLLTPILPIACLQAAEDTDVEARLKAAYVYNFARFVEWPHHSQAPVRIGVLGHGDLASPLEEVIRGKLANGRPIQMMRIASPVEAEHCEILLLERSENKHAKEILQSLKGKPILTVCDGNCLKDGAMIAFQFVDESVRFQINQDTADQAGLKISSQLLKVALPASGRHF